MKVWDSESENRLHDITEDDMYIALDDVNGVLRLADYDANDMHTTVMLFVGPDADKNAKQFDAAVECEEELDHNSDTVELINKCFGLG